MSEERQLTTTKVEKQLFEDFKINAIKNKFTFTKLVERCMKLYNEDLEFRKKIHNTKM